MSATSRTVRRTCCTAVVLLAAAASCTSTPPSPGLSPCPLRAEVTLEPADPVNFSLPRAVSPDGAWVLLSHVEDDQLVLTRRSAVAGSPSLRLGSVPYPTGALTYPPLASMGPDGASAVFGYRGTAAFPGDVTQVPLRWTLASGTATEVPAPVVADPPPGIPYPPNVLTLSPDGRRIVWTQVFYLGAGSWNHVMTVTDAVTDAVVSQVQFQPEVQQASFLASVYDGRPSLDGRILTFRNGQFDTTTGQVALLTSVADELRDRVGGGQFTSLVSSPSGRWVLFQGSGGWEQSTGINMLVDMVTGDVAQLTTGTLGPAVTLTDEGEMVFTIEVGGLTQVHTRSADGVERWVVERTMQQSWPLVGAPRVAASADTRTVVFSQAEGANFRLVAERCT